MTMKKMIHTQHAPHPLGAYSQAIQVNNIVFISGQIPNIPKTNQMITNDFVAETKQVFDNIAAVAKAANGSLDHIIKLTIYLTDLNNFTQVNEIMMHYFQVPFPARSTVQVAALPANARIEIEALMAV
jgi:reactive intermediate/imine deaminase